MCRYKVLGEGVFIVYSGTTLLMCQQIQPPILPRKDLDALGVKYRRIPLMSIGADVYCDTRLILRKLEELFPDSSQYPSLSSSSPSRPMSELLSKFTVDAGVFTRAAQLLPLTLPIMKDEKFLKDREGFMGRSWKRADIAAQQPEAMAHMRECFDVLETILADGREWIAGTKDLSLADIEGVWPFDWLLDMKALSSTLISEEQYPKTFAWIAHFRTSLKSAKSRAPKPLTLKGPDAVKHISGAPYHDRNPIVDSNDPFGLKEGVNVEIWPIESGFSHRDQGRLVKLTKDEVAVAIPTETGGKEVRVHMPRWGFRIREVRQSAKL